jgi:hypothetical protein
MVYPALTNNFKKTLGFPVSEPVIVSSIRYEQPEDPSSAPEVA